MQSYVLSFAGHTYRPTEADRLALSRAVTWEGPDHDQVAQTLVNGFCQAYSMDHEHSLEHHVQAYAQPINPRWFPEGDRFQHFNAIDPVKYPLAAAVRRRDVLSKLTTFEPVVVGAVEKALARGPLDIQACCTDYAAAWLQSSWTPLTPPVNGRNRLWTRAPKWGGYTVTVA